MKGSRFTEEQIIGVLREQEAGARTEEVCRRHGISSATFWRKGPGGPAGLQNAFILRLQIAPRFRMAWPTRGGNDLA
jgi:putative transposase